jgi:hypothetical protein|tara:strand:+ start:523 stop:789 length:267 start_codon:yes stop_codon:yes gene_type:complete
MTESKTVEEFWGPSTQRDKLIGFYRAIKNKDSLVATRSLGHKARLIEVRSLAKVLIEDYDTAPAQLKTMLESAEWTPENIETVLCQKQ